MMLRIDSLSSEKKYLLNENNILKRNIDMVIYLYEIKNITNNILYNNYIH